jgi:hypothetical protein
MIRQFWAGALGCALLAVSAMAQTPVMSRPKAGPVEIYKLQDVKAGQQAIAWTVFQGTEPEAVPIEILGVWKNAFGPKQDVILGKMGGKAIRTNVAKGMSGSPVYIDGKLIGALSLGLSQFSPDAICGITPIELMLEINELDQSRPADARTPEKPVRAAAAEVPGELLQAAVNAGATAGLVRERPMMTPIATPLLFSGFSDSVLQQFGSTFEQWGMTPVQGGAGAALHSAKPAAGWQNALQPGQAIAGVLVSGDMSITGLGTVTYNDGKRVLGFGHQFFKLGPVDMPMSAAEILLVLSSQFQPSKVGNATEVVGALRQDRHTGIMGELGAAAEMIPVTLKVKALAGDGSAREKDYSFNVFTHQKWTPFLMMATLFNSIESMNFYADDTTFRLAGNIELDNNTKISLATMQAPTELPVPSPMLLAGWWADKFTRLYLNPVSLPKLKSVNAVIDMIPDRRVASIENAWIANGQLQPGDEAQVKVFLRPYRGGRIERTVNVKIPAGLAKGDYRILLSDADTLNRSQNPVARGYLDIAQTVSILNQERSNNRLYVSLVQPRPTFFAEDKTLPNLPASVLNVMQTGRASSRSLASSPETVEEQTSIPFDFVVNGSYSLKVTVR